MKLLQEGNLLIGEHKMWLPNSAERIKIDSAKPESNRVVGQARAGKDQ